MLVEFRKAYRADVPEIIRLLADDVLGKTRENFQNPLPETYYQAFADIDKDPNNLLLVGVLDNKIVATLQVTWLTHMTFTGSKRALIESVRVDNDYRSQGVGRQMFEYVITLAKQKGCMTMELTTNKKRAQALNFYEKLGFVNSHHGLKLQLK